MKKLELKHIAPYLAYGLEWEVVSRGAFTTSPDEVKKEKMTMANISLFLAKKAYRRLSCKPILRPLSQLTAEIEHNGEKFVPMDVLYESFRTTDLFYFDKKNLFKNPYEVIEKLFEWHFDVFGLIEQKLAIEKL